MRQQVYFEDVREGDELPTSYSLLLDALQWHLRPGRHRRRHGPTALSQQQLWDDSWGWRFREAEGSCLPGSSANLSCEA